jgi:Bacterial mobilisation protein (MobC)
MSHGTEKRARSTHITVRLTPDERAAIDSAAERAGLTAGSYARDTMLGAPAPRQVRRPHVEQKLLVLVLRALGYIGNNINQIARALNSGDEPDDAALRGALADLHTMRDAVLRALGHAQ